jgi:hypothetical protein
LTHVHHRGSGKSLTLKNIAGINSHYSSSIGSTMSWSTRRSGFVDRRACRTDGQAHHHRDRHKLQFETHEPNPAAHAD